MKIEIVDTVHRLMHQFEEKYRNETLFPVVLPSIKFTKRGRVAGCCEFTYYGEGGGTGTLNFNMQIAEMNCDDFIAFTVPHEVAHYCVSTKYGTIVKNGRLVHHGRQWEDIMRFFGIQNPTRCHNHKTPPVKKYTYHCGCREHKLTQIRHNKCRRGTNSYSCVFCGETLVEGNKHI